MATSPVALAIPVVFHAVGNFFALAIQLAWAALLGYPVGRALSSWSYHP